MYRKCIFATVWYYESQAAIVLLNHHILSTEEEASVIHGSEKELFLSSWPVPFSLQFLQRQSPKGTSHYSNDCFQVCFSSVLNMIGIALCVLECCVLRSHPKYSSWKKCSPRGRTTLLEFFFPAGPGQYGC